MSAHDDTHTAGCVLCQAQVAAPQEFDDDRCHLDIRPCSGQDDGEPVIQCPHLAEPGRTRLCAHHLEGAHAAYGRWSPGPRHSEPSR